MYSAIAGHRKAQTLVPKTVESHPLAYIAFDRNDRLLDFCHGDLYSPLVLGTRICPRDREFQQLQISQRDLLHTLETILFTPFTGPHTKRCCHQYFCNYTSQGQDSPLR
jgi:hypothetical protein